MDLVFLSLCSVASIILIATDPGREILSAIADRIRYGKLPRPDDTEPKLQQGPTRSARPRRPASSKQS
jgi:hypothetical protein